MHENYVTRVNFIKPLVSLDVHRKTIERVSRDYRTSELETIETK